MLGTDGSVPRAPAMLKLDIAWPISSEMKRRKLSLEELPPVMLALVGVLGIGPMGVYRLLEGDYVIAAFDFGFVAGFVAILWAVYVKRAIRAASIAMALIAITTAVVSVRVRGGDQVVWMYPALVALFYLMKPKEAAVSSVIAMALVMPAIFGDRSFGEVLVLIASLAVTICLSVAFSALTWEQRRELRARTLIDPLTGAGNRRALTEDLEGRIAKAKGDEENFVLIMLDVDHFKSVNDQHGHATGDTVLQTIAKTLRENIGPQDAFYRVGGEEFIIVSGGTGLAGASKLAETLRITIAETVLRKPASKDTFSVTASFGLAEYGRQESMDSLYKRADDALYEAKRSGRNCLHSSERTVSLSGTANYLALPRVLGELVDEDAEDTQSFSEAS